MDNVVSVSNAMRYDYLTEGAALLVDKPVGWTSFDVVNKIRYAIRSCLEVKKYKVGHAGTLDPLATGLLIICIGKYTKLVEEIVARDKGYEAEITLGASTPSYDLETLPEIYYPDIEISDEALLSIEQHFTGNTLQIPPMFSAVKVKGIPLYRLARKGEEIKREPRKINISNLEVRLISKNRLLAKISCSKGTYIRTLAHDIGTFLHTGGYLSQLRRTRIGNYHVEEAVNLEELIQQIDRLKK